MYAEFDGQELGNCDGIGLEGNIEVALQSSFPMYYCTNSIIPILGDS